ncbi:hypothetical protein MPSEU_000141600 [Mayamaea pseudoterrestris]|nr:hypothetical protein MPSEU_000141600 [Mayamaea pseudoterrestris]
MDANKHALEFQRLMNAQRRRKEGPFRTPRQQLQPPHNTPFATSAKNSLLRETTDSKKQVTTTESALTPFSNIARVVTFSPSDDELEDISLIPNDTSQITDRSPSPPGESFASFGKKHGSSRRISSSLPPGFSPSHPSPPGNRFDHERHEGDDGYAKDDEIDEADDDDDGQPWAMIGDFETHGDDPADYSSDLVIQQSTFTPEVTPLKNNTTTATKRGHGARQTQTLEQVCGAATTLRLAPTLATESPPDDTQRIPNAANLNVSSDSQQQDPPSALDVFRVNETDLALEEQAFYLDKIQELEEQLRDAHILIQQQQHQAVTPGGVQNGANLLLQLKSKRLQTPKTPKPTLPPSLESLWERNQTLVTEIRFADQTCVELSSEKESLQSRLQATENRLVDERATNQRLIEQVKEANQLFAQAQSRSDLDAVRMEQLQTERLQDKETIHRLQQELTHARDELESKEQGVSLAEALQRGLAEASQNKRHVQLVDSLQQKVVQIAKEKDDLEKAYDRLKNEHNHLQQKYNAVKTGLQCVEETHKAEYTKMAETLASVLEWVTGKTDALDQSVNEAVQKCSIRVSSLTLSVASLKAVADANLPPAPGDRSPLARRSPGTIGSPESAVFFTPVNQSRNGFDALTGIEDTTKLSAAIGATVTDDELEGMKKSLQLLEADDVYESSNTPKAVSFAMDRLDTDANTSLGNQRLGSNGSMDLNGSVNLWSPGFTEAQLEARIAELTNELDALNTAHVHVWDERESLQSELATVQEKAKYLEKQLQSAELDVKSARDESAQSRLAFQTQIDSLRSIINTLTNECDLVKLSFQQSQEQLKYLSDERDLLTNERGEKELLERKVVETETLCMTLRNQLETLENEISEQGMQVREMEQEVTGHLLAASEQELKLKLLVEENAMIRRDLDDVIINTGEKLSQTADELEIALSAMEQSQKRCNALEGSLAELQDKYSALTSKADETTACLQVTSREYDQAQAELAVWRQHLTTLENLISEFVGTDEGTMTVMGVDTVERYASAIAVLEQTLTCFKSKNIDLSNKLAETIALLTEKDTDARSSFDQAAVLLVKVHKLKDYGRKLRSKCDEWELYCDKQSATIAKLQSLYHQTRTQAMEFMHALEKREQEYLNERAFWESERQQFTNQFEDITRVLLETPTVAILNSPPPS